MAQRMTHHCHAVGCATATKPAMFMCLRHWRMVPVAAQRQIWATYRKGQEVDKRPSPEYLDAARRARSIVAGKEGQLDLFNAEERQAATLRRQVVDAIAERLGDQEPKA